VSAPGRPAGEAPSAPRAGSAASAAHKAVPLLDVRDFSLEFRTRGGTVRALQNVGLTLHKGEIVGLVGESGSGKSVLAYSILGISDRAARITAGRAVFGGLDLIKASESELADIVGRQIEDVLRRHAAVRSADLKARAIAALREVAIADPERRYGAYPFELSGGMCQRVMIAIALACRPQLLIADEPTTGLDVTTQAAVMDLVVGLARERQMATLFITHDLGLAADYCDRIVVMHAGHVVESAPARALFGGARHPYSAKLISSTPREDTVLARLTPIAGSLPDLRRADLPACRFAERCERATAQCRSSLPALDPAAPHAAVCWHPLVEDTAHAG
jgi:peptide/nickel transport system ATP-binding protein